MINMVPYVSVSMKPMSRLILFLHFQNIKIKCKDLILFKFIISQILQRHKKIIFENSQKRNWY